MKIKELLIEPYQFLLTTQKTRHGFYVHLVTEEGSIGSAEIAPFPSLSLETTKEALEQLQAKKEQILKLDWTEDTLLQQLFELNLFASSRFGLESALYALLKPIPSFRVSTSALLMGSPQQILQQANLRKKEGFYSAKLKIGHLKFQEAKDLIEELKEIFSLRIDVNRAWTTSDSLRFFSQFPLGTFEYVEEPFQNPKDLSVFPHPLAVDESFPSSLSLKELEALPTLKALIYKPTIQGGFLDCFPLYTFATQRGISFVLSSSFESPLGLTHIASLAHRLALNVPIGIGTYHYLDPSIDKKGISFSGPFICFQS